MKFQSKRRNSKDTFQHELKRRKNVIHSKITYFLLIQSPCVFAQKEKLFARLKCKYSGFRLLNRDQRLGFWCLGVPTSPQKKNLTSNSRPCRTVACSCGNSSSASTGRTGSTSDTTRASRCPSGWERICRRCCTCIRCTRGYCWPRLHKKKRSLVRLPYGPHGQTTDTYHFSCLISFT